METWKKIEGWQYYEVSDLGRVRSLTHESIAGLKIGRILKTHPQRKGYLLVTLDENRRRLTSTVHKLVALAFIGNAPLGCAEINHKDGNKRNNRVDNLEWCTRAHNMAHASRTGRMKGLKGSANATAKLDEDKVRAIRALKNDLNTYQIAELYGVTATTIQYIRNRKTWIHVE